MDDDELVQVSCLIPREWVDELERRAGIEKLKRSDIVRRAVGNELRRPPVEEIVIHRGAEPEAVRPRRSRFARTAVEPVS